MYLHLDIGSESKHSPLKYAKKKYQTKKTRIKIIITPRKYFFKNHCWMHFVKQFLLREIKSIVYNYVLDNFILHYPRYLAGHSTELHSKDV